MMSLWNLFWWLTTCRKWWQLSIRMILSLCAVENEHSCFPANCVLYLLLQFSGHQNGVQPTSLGSVAWIFITLFFYFSCWSPPKALVLHRLIPLLPNTLHFFFFLVNPSQWSLWNPDQQSEAGNTSCNNKKLRPSQDYFYIGCSDRIQLLKFLSYLGWVRRGTLPTAFERVAMEYLRRRT